jgi:acyl-CoA thioesterase I
MNLRRGARILFQGDSITDVGRRDTPDGLGSGYPAVIQGILGSARSTRGYEILNRGVGGDRSVELLARWKADCEELKPDLLSIMVGVNDVWRIRGGYMGQAHIPPQDFAKNLEELILRAKGAGVGRIALMSPTTIDNGKDPEFNALLDEDARYVRELAKKHGAVYVPSRECQARLLRDRPEIVWTIDGCHPSLAGHVALASCWLKALRSLV